MTKLKVSFVVIAYNEAKNIGRTLDAICALSGLVPGLYEVIVVNDGSRDGTADVVAGRAARNPDIKLIDLPQNRGRGAARATGIAAAQGELIANVDADILLPSDWLVRAESALVGHDAVGGTAVPDGDVAYVYRATKLKPRVVSATTSVTGNNGLYRRQVFDLISFDSSLREGEDVALNQAGPRLGLSFATVPGLLVEHNENKTFLGSLRWLFESGMGATRQLLVYREVRTPDLATGAFLASVAVGVLLQTFADAPTGWVIPGAVLLAVSTQHVRSRFETPLTRVPSAGLAIVIDCAHLLSYFAGRVVGIIWVLRPRPSPNGQSAPTHSSPTRRAASHSEMRASDLGESQPVKLLAMPRDTFNPYQSLLYEEMEKLGVEVRYTFSLTPSRSLNQLLLPLETVLQRIRGVQVVHVHWLHSFALYGCSRYPVLRRIGQLWLYVWLWTVRMTGMRLVWTAHNVLPLAQLFADDLVARRRLIDATHLVITHSKATLIELAELGLVPRKSVVIPHGPYEVGVQLESLRPPCAGQGPRRLLFFGAVEPYKGVETLIAAFGDLPLDQDAQLAIVGECRDPSLRASLTEMVNQSPRPVKLRLERVDEGEISDVLQNADVVVLPYRRSSTSGSAVLALSHGRPVIVPDLPGLSELPDGAVIRYDRTILGLTDALSVVVLADTSVMTRMSDAAYAYCESISWESIARRTLSEMNQIVSEKGHFSLAG